MNARGNLTHILPRISGALRFCLLVQEFKLTGLSLDEAASQGLLHAPWSVVPLA